MTHDLSHLLIPQVKTLHAYILGSFKNDTLIGPVLSSPYVLRITAVGIGNQRGPKQTGSLRSWALVRELCWSSPQRSTYKDITCARAVLGDVP